MGNQSTTEIDLSAVGLCLQIGRAFPKLAKRVYGILGACEVEELRAAMLEINLPGLHSQLQYPDGLVGRLDELDSVAADAIVEAVYQAVTAEGMKNKATVFFSPTTQAQPTKTQGPKVEVQHPQAATNDFLQIAIEVQPRGQLFSLTDLPRENLQNLPLDFLVHFAEASYHQIEQSDDSLLDHLLQTGIINEEQAGAIRSGVGVFDSITW